MPFSLSWRGSPHGRLTNRRPRHRNSQIIIRPSLAARSTRAAEEALLHPLSESLEKLRRAQRALCRRKRRSKVRVSFPHQQPSVIQQKQQRPVKTVIPTGAPCPSPVETPHIGRYKWDPTHGAPISDIYKALPQQSVEEQQPIQLDPRDLRYGSSRYPQAPALIEQCDGQGEDAPQPNSEQPYWGTLRKSVVLASTNPLPVEQPRHPNGYEQQAQVPHKPTGYYEAPHAGQRQRRIVPPRHQKPAEVPSVRPARAHRRPRAKEYKDEAVQTSFSDSVPRKISVASKRYGLADPVV